MPKSKHRRKGDKRPVRRSGSKENKPTDYRTGELVSNVPHYASSPALDASGQIPTDMRKIAYLDRVGTLPKVFTPDECAQIINTALNDWGEQESMIQKDEGGEIKQNFKEDFDYRNTTLFIPKKPDEWLFSKVLGTIQAFNNSKNGYNFDITGLAEPPNVMRYEAPDINKHGKPGRYDWHMDLGPGPVPSMRKISYSLLLNPGEYEGGELCFHIGRYTDPFPGQDSAEGLGNMLIFPSYVVHRVLPVTKGTRYSLVGWVHGNSFL